MLSILPIIIIASIAISFVAAIAFAVFKIKSDRITRENWAKYHLGAEWSPAYTAVNGKRYRVHIPTQRIVAA
jgi:hypothetical protein